jgi:hypothetical protein
MPDFLVIGAMKAGTTTLCGHLARHPGVFFSTPKEPQYWSRAHVRERGVGWYQGLFAAARPDQRCGEGSACYSRWPEFDGVPGRIAAAMPGVKLVYIVRHPVERTYSHYGHEMEERHLHGTGPQRTLAEALAELPNLIDASLYHAQIERYLAHFPRAALHVLLLEDLRRAPDATWGALEDFLGLAHAPLGAGGEAADNRAGDRLARVESRRRVQHLRRLPGVRHAVDWLPAGVRHAAGNLLRRPALTRWWMRQRVAEHRAALSPLTPALRAELLERFREPNRRLEAFLGRELPEWRQ